MITSFQKRKVCSLFFIFCFFFHVQAQEDILTEADEMPYFAQCAEQEASVEAKRYCSDNSLVKFIGNQLIYPEEAKKNNIKGTVYVSFVVDESGKTRMPVVLRDIGGGCGEAALEVIRKMPLWTPAQNNGKAVKVKLNLPIRFDFKNDPVNEKAQKYQINWGNLTGTTVSKLQLETLLAQQLRVRDEFGDDKPIVELIFAFEKKRAYYEGSSSGKVNKEMRKVIDKAKKDGTFTITAVIQIKGELIFVKRAFEVI